MLPSRPSNPSVNTGASLASTTGEKQTVILLGSSEFLCVVERKSLGDYGASLLLYLAYCFCLERLGGASFFGAWAFKFILWVEPSHVHHPSCWMIHLH